MDVVVVGGGVVGALTALECARAGHRVTLVERGPLPNPAASSHDQHRNLRALHPGDPSTSLAGLRAHEAWLRLESVLGKRFYHVVGALSVGPRVSEATAVPGERLDSAELRRRFPQFVFPDGSTGFLERDAGVLLADKVLDAVVAWLLAQPDVDLLPHNEVVAVEPGAVRLAGGRVLHGDRIVVAAGPWTRSVVKDDQVTVRRQTMLYCSPPAWPALPAIPSLGTDSGAWLVPPVGGTQLKLSADSACRPVSEVDGTTPTRTDALVGLFRELVPAFEPGWVVGARDCHYTIGPDGGARLVEFAGGVLALTACGGGSFKFAPLIGRALTARIGGDRSEPTGLTAMDHPVPGGDPC
ncbi:FAD-dependent oxidoreductase [Actinokineospora enzanensis]|uniref:FAD-dependent oxidoreductase n=1 Tax=Actinokineospora enzanensis TaxID=155975 RepID=UPI0003628B4D|nr:FAD-dependent oxidoreductase [Actinokineospora enzanensis]